MELFSPTNADNACTLLGGAEAAISILEIYKSSHILIWVVSLSLSSIENMDRIFPNYRRRQIFTTAQIHWTFCLVVHICQSFKRGGVEQTTKTLPALESKLQVEAQVLLLMCLVAQIWRPPSQLRPRLATCSS